MASIRETIKRASPRRLRDAVIAVRGLLAAPPLEQLSLHRYETITDRSTRPRLTLVIPTVQPALAFGGVTTGLDLFLRLAKTTGADARIILDDFLPDPDPSVVHRIARNVGLDPAAIEIVARASDTPRIAVRAGDIFVGYNSWTVLNLTALVAAQAELAGGRAHPYLYLYQEFEPGFSAYSSTHLFAWRATRGIGRWWAIYNSDQLADYVAALGVAAERRFVIQPTLSPTLRPFLPGADGVEKKRRLLVYGRPSIPRNCFSAVEAGLREWVARDPAAARWEIVSAGSPHKPVELGHGVQMRSAGKMPLEDYARMLRETAVAVSLMSSPHPSYPPLEMAHFGALTITNSYAFKDLTRAHDNIVSLDDIAPEAIAAALTAACARFEADPAIGLTGRSHMPAYLADTGYPFMDELVAALHAEWAHHDGAAARVVSPDAAL